MKKTIFNMLFTVVLVVVLFSATVIAASADGEYTGTGTFNKCTGELTSGYYVFGVGTDDSSISALNTTSANNWIKFTDTTSTSGIITNPDISIVWYYDAAAGTFNNGTNYVAWPTTGNSAAIKTTGTPLTVSETVTAGVYNITVTTTSARMLRLNGTSGYRFYSASTGTNTFYFFKLLEEQPLSTQITQHSVTGKTNNAGTGYEYNYAFTMTSTETIKGTFVVALYDGQNELVGVKTILLSNDKTEHTEANTEQILTSSEAATYKVMFWGGLDTLRPLCKAESGDVESVS